jgi:hypothetical protein
VPADADVVPAGGVPPAGCGKGWGGTGTIITRAAPSVLSWLWVARGVLAVVVMRAATPEPSLLEAMEGWLVLADGGGASMLRNWKPLADACARAGGGAGSKGRLAAT